MCYSILENWHTPMGQSLCYLDWNVTSVDLHKSWLIYRVRLKFYYKVAWVTPVVRGVINWSQILEGKTDCLATAAAPALPRFAIRWSRNLGIKLFSEPVFLFPQKLSDLIRSWPRCCPLHSAQTDLPQSRQWRVRRWRCSLMRTTLPREVSCQ